MYFRASIAGMALDCRAPAERRREARSLAFHREQMVTALALVVLVWRAGIACFGRAADAAEGELLPAAARMCRGGGE